MYLYHATGIKRAADVAVYPEDLPLWQRIPEGLRLLLTGALGGIMIAALLGIGLLGVV